MSTLAQAAPGRRRRARSRPSARPPAVATVKRGGATSRRRPRPGPGSACRCRSSRPGRRRRCAAPWRGRPRRARAATRITPSAPTPRWRSHRARTWPAAGRTASSASSTTRKSLPAPSCLVQRASPALGRLSHAASLPPATPRPGADPRRPERPTTATGSSPGSSQRIRGSRRNQAHWRRAKAAGPADRLGHARRRGARRPRRGPAAPGSRGPGGPCGTARRAGRPGPGPRRAARRPSSGRSARSMRRSTAAGSKRQADQGAPGRRVGARGPGRTRRRAGPSRS